MTNREFDERTKYFYHVFLCMYTLYFVLYSLWWEEVVVQTSSTEYSVRRTRLCSLADIIGTVLLHQEAGQN